MSNDPNETLKDIYHEMLSQDSRRITQETNSKYHVIQYSSSNCWNDENAKRKKIRYYYEKYTFKKFLSDMFFLCITSGAIILFFIYRHNKHKSIIKRIENGEFSPEDFEKDISLDEPVSNCKFLNFKL